MAKAGGFGKCEILNKDRVKYWAMMNKMEDSVELNGKTYYAPDVKMNPSLNDEKEEPLLL